MSSKKDKLSRTPVMENIVNALLCAANDGDEKVRTTVIASIYEIGFRQPNIVLSLATEYLNKNQKIDLTHRVTLLKSVHSILGEKRDEIVDSLSQQLIQLSVAEMTRDKEVVPDWQQAASSLIVSLGMRYPTQIMDELLKRFETGTIPHYFVMKTLGDFIGANRMLQLSIPTIPRIRDVLSRVLPILGSIKHDNIKWVFAAALGHFADGIVSYVSNIEAGSDKTLTLYSFSSEFYPALELMFSKWLSTNQEKVRLVVIQAIGSICAILSVEQLDSQINRIVTGVLSHLKKEKDLLPVTQALCAHHLASRPRTRGQEELDLVGDQAIDSQRDIVVCQKVFGTGCHLDGVAPVHPIAGCSHIVDTEIGRPAPAAPPKKSDVPADMNVTEIEFRSICDNILNLITTTIPDMESVLWPYLFEAVTPADYTGAVPVVAKCITYIAANKRETDAPDYFIDFDKEVNLPKPTAIIARLFVLLSTPHRRNQIGVRVLELMRNIGPILHPSICDMWDVTLPKLIHFLEEHPDSSETWNKTQWEELVLRLLSETIKNAADDEWTVHLGNAYADQIEHYKRDPILKRSLYKQLGLLMQKCSHKEFVRSKIEIMFNSVDYTNALENEGCAIGLGYTAASHFDIVLEKISMFIKNNMVKKSGFFSKKGGPKGIKNCVLQSLAYCATYAQPALLSSRVEVHMINPIKPSIALLKKPAKKISAIKMIDHIGKALHQDRIPGFIFKQRDDLFKLVISYMSTPPPSVNLQTKIDGINACSTLINLQPLLPNDLENQIVMLLLQFYNTQSSAGAADEQEVNQLITAINNLFSTILFNQPTIACLNRLIQYLDPLSRSKDGHLREKSLFCILYLVKKFIEYSAESENLPGDKKFENIGTTLSIVIPRCTDPEVNIRKYAIESIQLILYVDYMLKTATPEMRRVKPIEHLHPLSSIKETITTTDVNEQFQSLLEVASVIAKMMPLDELPKFLEQSLKGLQDLQTYSTNGTCIIINGLVKSRGGELFDHVGMLVKGFLAAMEGITSDTTMNGTLVSLRSLANHHLIAVLSQLLEFPMPHSVHVIKALQIVSKDKNLVVPTFNHLMDLLNNKPIYEDKPDPKDKKKTVPSQFNVALATTSSLGEILQLEELEDVANHFYAQLFCTVSLRAGTTNNSLNSTSEHPGVGGAKGKSVTIIPSQQLIATFRQFFKCTKEDEMLEEIDSAIDNLDKVDYPKSLQEITSKVAQAHPDLIKPIFEYLIPYQKSNYVPQRVVTTAIVAELVNHCPDKELLQRLINTLLGALVEPAIKLISLKGLSNIVSCGAEQTNRYAPTVIDALSSSIDDSDEVMAMESMLGLSKIFTVVDESRVAPILVNICNRIKPAFEKPNDEIRAASFTLFGSLWRFGGGLASDPFYEQMHNNLPCLVMHVNDESAAVRSACKTTLRQLSALLRADQVKVFFHKRSFDADATLDYDEFLDELSKVLITFYTDRINYFLMTTIEYYKSNWVVLRGNAATLTGFILGNMPEEKRISTTLNPAIITQSLIRLLGEKSAEVRKKAADSMSYLHTY
ncbi:hypothetical protein DFA_04746 [Cavenderia fasciculata]|uniref:HEAT repeat-containing protein n=1 Tax=Cavenderia fasciculata TaxID=261658 RepID=F4PQF3_CACFS|nr:uncharacterized protein DFA_04746 [Cavenderia fasciculata]EGG22616.1 hypothetical protein DFA_04746 [Cavenderia fasciculata]|eukprot:XP_004360467.1 hypothetical protein DFA_04746 [Cavenderia fasciculata]